MIAVWTSLPSPGGDGSSGYAKGKDCPPKQRFTLLRDCRMVGVKGDVATVRPSLTKASPTPMGEVGPGPCRLPVSIVCGKIKTHPSGEGPGGAC